MWFAIAGLAVGVAAALVLANVLDDDASDDAPEIEPLSDDELDRFPRPQAPEIEAFNQAWQTYRTGEYLITFDVERERVDDGERLRSTTVYAQLPPDRLVVGPGGVTGVIDGHPINCAGEEVDVDVNCTAGATDIDYSDMVAREAEARGTYFVGDNPVYLVRRDTDGCFELVLARPVPTPPYGQSSLFCFDEVTGALRFSEVDRGTTIERSTATSIETDVTRDDLDALVE